MTDRWRKKVIKEIWRRTTLRTSEDWNSAFNFVIIRHGLRWSILSDPWTMTLLQVKRNRAEVMRILYLWGLEAPMMQVRVFHLRCVSYVAAFSYASMFPLNFVGIFETTYWDCRNYRSLITTSALTDEENAATMSQNCVSQTGFRGTLRFQRTCLEIPREIVE